MGAGLDSEERELLERCRSGDEAAWAKVFRDHAPRIALFSRGMLGRQDVDDLVQRVFIELVASLPRFRGDSSLASWLHGIAHNLIHKEVRSTVRDRGKTAAYAQELGLGEGAGGTDRRLEARERLRRLAQALDELDLRFRAIWVMRELEGLSVEEVGAATGERAATVRTRHHRARAKVMAALEKLEQEPVPRVAEPGPASGAIVLKGVRT